MSREVFLNLKELSARWNGGVGVATLANWRAMGKGSRFIKLGGRVAYRLRDIEEWENARSARNTAQYGGDNFQKA